MEESKLHQEWIDVNNCPCCKIDLRRITTGKNCAKDAISENGFYVCYGCAAILKLKLHDGGTIPDERKEGSFT
jgi:hypothetical protein